MRSYFDKETPCKYKYCLNFSYKLCTYNTPRKRWSVSRWFCRRLAWSFCISKNGQLLNVFKSALEKSSNLNPIGSNWLVGIDHEVKSFSWMLTRYNRVNHFYNNGSNLLFDCTWIDETRNIPYLTQSVNLTVAIVIFRHFQRFEHCKVSFQGWT